MPELRVIRGADVKILDGLQQTCIDLVLGRPALPAGQHGKSVRNARLRRCRATGLEPGRFVRSGGHGGGTPLAGGAEREAGLEPHRSRDGPTACGSTPTASRTPSSIGLIRSLSPTRNRKTAGSASTATCRNSMARDQPQRTQSTFLLSAVFAV